LKKKQDYEDWDDVMNKVFKTESHDFQQTSFSLIQEENTSLLVTAPTGSGKTHVAYAAIFHVLKNHPTMRVYYVCPTKSLVNQIYCELVSIFQGKRNKEKVIGISTGSIKENTDAPIIVTLPQSLQQKLQHSDDKFQQSLKFVILDEVHQMFEEEKTESWRDFPFPSQYNKVCWPLSFNSKSRSS